jgi:hypothetical protein
LLGDDNATGHRAASAAAATAPRTFMSVSLKK